MALPVAPFSLGTKARNRLQSLSRPVRAAEVAEGSQLEVLDLSENELVEMEEQVTRGALDLEL